MTNHENTATPIPTDTERAELAARLLAEHRSAESRRALALAHVDTMWISLDAAMGAAMPHLAADASARTAAQTVSAALYTFRAALAAEIGNPLARAAADAGIPDEPESGAHLRADESR